jgi:hypothetical protein
MASTAHLLCLSCLGQHSYRHASRSWALACMCREPVPQGKGAQNARSVVPRDHRLHDREVARAQCAETDTVKAFQARWFRLGQLVCLDAGAEALAP